MTMSISGADTWLTLNNTPLSFQDISENLAAQVIECNSPSADGSIIQVTPLAPHGLKIFVEGKQLQSAYAGYWEWRPPLGFAGLCKLLVITPDYPELVAKIRVLPEKLSYERHKAMLSDLSKIAVDLLIRMNSWASEIYELQIRDQEVSPLRDYTLVKEIMRKLEDVIFHISLNPHRELQEHSVQQLLTEVERFSSEAVPIPGNVLVVPTRFGEVHNLKTLPEAWSVQKKTLTYDVYENRLLKQFVQHQLVSKLYFLQERAKSELQRLDQSLKVALLKGYATDKLLQEIESLKHVIVDCQQMRRKCINWAGEAFLRSVQPLQMQGNATQILLKSPFYSLFFQLYLRFQQELKISLDLDHYLTELATQKVNDLYEMWSVFEITKIAQEALTGAGFIVTSQTIFYEVERNLFQFRVRKNVPSIIFAKDDLRVEIKYEPLYLSKDNPSVATISALVTDSDDPNDQLTPDLAIEIYERDQVKDVILFDVKYKWKGVEGSRGPTRNDKNTMRGYRQEICYKPYSPSTSPLIRGIVSHAYIIYPGDILWHDPDNRIGALPLIPDLNPHLRHDVENTVKNLLHLVHLL
jgi:hypothetical protein